MVKSKNQKSDNKLTISSMSTSDRIKLSEALFNKLSEVLNQVHNSSYSERFWKILLEPYVNAVITRKSFMEESIRHVEPKLEAVISFGEPSVKERLRRLTIYYTKAARSLMVRAKITRALKKYRHISLGFHDPQSISADTDVHLDPYFPLIWSSGENAKRKTVLAIAEKQQDTYHHNIVKQLPKVYVEHFQALLKSIPLYTTTGKVMHVSTFQSFYMRLMVAKYVFHGAKLYYYQHGGFYGEMNGHYGYYYESSISDQFRTWGWKLKESDVPWKAYRLEKFKRQIDSESSSSQGSILLCANRFNPARKGKNEDAVLTFLERIDRGKYETIVLRPRAKSKLENAKSEFAFVKDDSVTVDSGQSRMTRLVKESAVVIQLAYPSTSFLECLYVDQPTVAILTNEDPTEIVKKYYEFFLEMGVLHYDIISLTKHLNSIDVARWWQRVIRHPLYGAFKKEFLRKV